MTKSKLAIIAAAVVAIAAGSAAYASIPDGNGVVHACYGKPGSARPGQVRVIDSSSDSCNSFETALNWNQAGQPGVKGDKGDKGDTGQPGQPGPALLPASYVKRVSSHYLPHALSDASSFVGSLALPAGTYVVTVTGHDSTPDSLSAHCRLYRNTKSGALLDEAWAVADATAEALDMIEVVGNGSDFTVDLYCDSNGEDNNSINYVTMTATQAGTVTTQ